MNAERGQTSCSLWTQRQRNRCEGQRWREGDRQGPSPSDCNYCQAGSDCRSPPTSSWRPECLSSAKGITARTSSPAKVQDSPQSGGDLPQKLAVVSTPLTPCGICCTVPFPAELSKIALGSGHFCTLVSVENRHCRDLQMEAGPKPEWNARGCVSKRKKGKWPRK